MHYPPAFCPRHGRFDAAIQVPGPPGAEIIDGTAQCPQCGRTSPIPSGRYEAVERGLIYTPMRGERPPVDPDTGARWSRPRISLALSALEEVQRRGATSLDEAVEIAGAISPEIAQVLRTAEPWTRNQKLALTAIVVPALIALLTFAKGATADARPTVQELVVTVEQICRVADEQPPDRPVP